MEHRQQLLCKLIQRETAEAMILAAGAGATSGAAEEITVVSARRVEAEGERRGQAGIIGTIKSATFPNANFPSSFRAPPLRVSLAEPRCS